MKDGFISKLQRYSTRDGPGIRTTVFCVGCNLRCLWCANPELILTGAKILYHREHCARCGACAALSGGAIVVGPDGCEIDRARCTNLAECAAACYHNSYETIGESAAPKELAEKLLGDKVFYEESGGGVTFSGGEPALQAEFVATTMTLLKKEHVHTALDTAGNVPWETLALAVEKADLVLYDIKTFDEALHRRSAGVSNALILENAERLAQKNKAMFIRLIVVPGYNDGEDFLRRLDFVVSLGKAVRQVDILPLHRLAAGKYRALGIADPLEGTRDCPDDIIRRAAAQAEGRGFTLTVGG